MASYAAPDDSGDASPVIDLGFEEIVIIPRGELERYLAEQAHRAS
jgi:hypothetical protein